MRKRRATIDLAFQVALLDSPPPPLEGKIAIRCRDCSLHRICLPEEVRLLEAQRKGNTVMPTLYLTEDRALVRRDTEDCLLVQVPEQRGERWLSSGSSL